MSLIDDYQNSTEFSDDNPSGADPNTSRRQRSELERQITMLDSDLKKNVRELEDLEMQKRRFKKDEDRLRVERGELDQEIAKLANSRRLLEEEITVLKKKLKILK